METEYSNYFRNQANFIPDIDTKIKTIRLNYHFFQTSINGPGNFETSNSTHMEFWDSVETKINYFFSNLAAPYNDLSCICGSNCHIADSRIRVKFENFIEHTDNVLYGDLDLVVSTHQSFLVNDEKVLNVFDVGSNGSALGGSVWSYSTGSYSNFSSNPYSNDYKIIVMANTFDRYNDLDGLTPKIEHVAERIFHELGHVFELKHLYTDTHQETLDDTHIDYLWDIFGDGNFGCTFGLGNSHYCTPESSTCIKNIVGGHVYSPQREISPLQLGRMHQTAMLSPVHKFFDCDMGGGNGTFLITSNTTIEHPIRFFSDVYVNSGKTLTIKCTVKMPNEAKIVVLPGGKLVIDGGTVTSACEDKFWKGIELWGNSSLNQFNNNQPEVEIINGATIERARVGVLAMRENVWNTMGGVVTALNSTFLNCRKSIEFMAYNNRLPSTNQIVKNLSRVEGCTFETNDDFPFNALSTSVAPVTSHVSLWAVREVSLKNNEFVNNVTGNNNFGIGIATIGSKLYINNNSFKGLHIGLEMSNSSALTALEVFENEFEINFHSIVNASHMFVRTHRNEIKAFNSSGISLVNTAFNITSENEIENNNYVFGSYVRNAYGVGSGSELYKNNYTIGGFHAFSTVNTPSTYQQNDGLYYKCNLFQNNGGFDIYAFKGNIQQQHGACVTGNNTTPAGNIFDPELSPNNGGRNIAVHQPYPANKFFYYSHHRKPSEPKVVPNSKTPNVNNWECSEDYNENACPTKPIISETPVDASVTRNVFSGKRGNYEDLVAEYAINVDGGDKEYILSLINDPEADAGDIEAIVRSHAPYSSSEVLIACINRTPALTPLQLFRILEDNSPLSIEVRQLDSTINALLGSPYSGYIADLQIGNSLYDELSFALRYYAIESEVALTDYLNHLYADTNVEGATDSVAYYFADRTTPEHLLASIFAHWELRNYGDAEQKLGELNELEYYEGWYDLLSEMHNEVVEENEPFLLYVNDSSFAAKVHTVAADTTNSAYLFARGIIKVFEDTLFYLHLPDTSEVMYTAKKGEENISNTLVLDSPNSTFKLYPNPANSQVVLQTNLFKKGSYEIINASGQQMLKGKLTGVETQVDIKALNKGIYFISVRTENEESTLKLIKQ